MEDRNLIWISADNSGNKVDTRKRMSHPLLAIAALSEDYQLAGDRIYLAGFSGGGRVASIVASEYPNLFTGAIYMSGVNFWKTKSSANVERIRLNSYVFITGRQDFNFRDTKKVHRLYEKNKVKNLMFLDVPNLKHETPGSEDFKAAVTFLDDSRK